MSKIIQLTDSVISKIAAGEIVERPAYIIKELVDNALDAGATSIEVKVENGGLDKIIVTDNGEGMSKEDLLLSYKRHTTSKLADNEDLVDIRTLGFRGEALASIAAVGDVTIRSREVETAAGHEVEIQNGELKHSKPIGMPTGTQIIVSNIFERVPARKKYITSAQSEYRKILEIVERYILANPDVRFDFYHNQRSVYTLPPVKDSFERMKAIFSQNTIEYYIPISFSEDYSNLSGYIAKPQLSYSSTKKQYFFVNQRYIQDNDLSRIVKSAYGTLLEPKSYPSFVLFLDIPHQLIDVNVDPKKEKINFVDKGVVVENIQKSITDTLGSHNLHFIDKRWSQSEEYQQSGLAWQVREGDMNSYAAGVLRDKILPQKIKPKYNFSTVTQLHNLYIVVESNQGIVLFDQHAAHERILYEKLQEEFANELSSRKVYTLPKPEILHLNSQDNSLIQDHFDDLEEYGFCFESMDGEVKVTAVPKLFKDKKVKALINEIIDLLSTDGKIEPTLFEDKMITFLACRNSVKAGDSLSKKRCREIIEDLEKVNNNATCPHGRPTQILLPFKDINLLFKRN